MNLLKVKVKGLPLFKESFEVDFFAGQRVVADRSEGLYNLFSNIYLNNVISFIGINASGKTTTLKVLTFLISLLNNKPVNSIGSRDILKDMENGKKVVFETYFYRDNGTVNKLETTIIKELPKPDSDIEKENHYIIEKEKLWSKDISTVKVKKDIYNFEKSKLAMERNNDEQYLMDDVSITIASNKKYNSNIFIGDMTEWTNFNMMTLFGRFPKELIAFLDPSIEYLKCNVEKKNKAGKNGIEIKLKFKEKEEIIFDSPLTLNNYLSSGTLKGISVFMNAFFAFEKGGYLIIDEIENHFNKEIVSTLIRFFMDKNINKKGASLIFSTHYSELLDEFERNDSIYITRNRKGISVENLSNILNRNDIKKSEAYQSDFLEGTVPAYEAYMALKKVLLNNE